MKRLKDIPEEERIKTNFPVRLPKDLHSRLKAKCALNNVSMSDYYNLFDWKGFEQR